MLSRRYALVAALMLETSGCSFLFVRTPTPETAKAPGSCEGRGVAAATDGAVAALSLYQVITSLNASQSPYGAVELRSQPWNVRYGATIWGGIGLLALSSTVYGVSKTSECSQMRASMREPPSVSPGPYAPWPPPSGHGVTPPGPPAPSVVPPTATPPAVLQK